MLLQDILAYEREVAPADPATVEIPLDGSSRIAQLGLGLGLVRVRVIRGFSCTDCGHLTANRNNMVSHRTEARHAGRGGAGAGWHEVMLQSFMQGHYVKYWIVEDGDEGTAGGAGTEANEDEFEQALSQYVKQDRAELERLHRTVQAEGGLDKKAPFVANMGWAEHLRGKDMVALKQLSEQPPSRRR